MPSYIADFMIEFGEVGGDNWTAASEELLGDILQLTVEESLHLPAMFTLVIGNSYMPVNEDDEPWRYDSLFQFGSGIRIGFASRTTQDENYSTGQTVESTYDIETDQFSTQTQRTYTYVIEGEVTAIEAHFSLQSQAPIVIRGYDISHRLHRGRYNRSFQNMTDSDIVTRIVREVGIQAGTIEATEGPYGYNDISGVNGYVFQENQTNMEFLRERAARHGFELFVENSKLYFRKPTAETTLTLVWQDTLLGFRVRASSAEQVSAVEVRSWDYSRKQPIVSIKSSAQVLTSTDQGDGNETASIFNGKPASPRMVVVDQPVFGIEEAEMIAQALYDELGGEFIYADARAEGNPEIRAGRVVKLTDMGKYTGQYYVTETRHLYDNNIYTTEFSVRGLRSGDLLSTIAPRHPLRPGQTFLVGIVTENRDPNGWGRVRVKFPTLSEEHNSYWARMVAVGAGASRGFDCLPEIGDEVLVAFEHGDIHRPYILGGVWNGIDKPPESFASAPNTINSVVSSGSDMGTVRLRTFKTRVGHQLQFAEQDASTTAALSETGQASGSATSLFGLAPLLGFKGNHLWTAGGHTLDLCDLDRAQVSCIQLKTSRQHGLKLNDAGSESGISLQTAARQSISLVDVPTALSLQPQINLNTSGNVVINAGSPPILGTLFSAGAFAALGAQASQVPGTAAQMLTAKVANFLSSIELTGGYINQLSLGGVTLVAGTGSSARVLPQQAYLTSPGISISAVPDSLSITLPTPGMLNLTGAALVNILSPIAITLTASVVTISAPTIVLNGNVTINGGLTLNGSFVKDGISRF
ncbi:hypothetical protein BST81_13070 [Leptolyngbya sp. 'hensonii']|uniref:VgrG-related protein n=1 Tax=Leptolyngbya sp. 'hensonii' TaxID=1922337 RepID=UPI00094F5727|nr:VgrG-related protein [Leptolyngbya sp. 'hensonii']OLP17976.1 hypothetical protein BST81_13070 [Leptolyngbya sp. 'hensonii']